MAKCAGLAPSKGQQPYAFHFTGEGSNVDCLTTAAALLLLPAEASAGGPLAPAEWRKLARRAAAHIGPGATDGAAAGELAQVAQEARAYLKGRLGGRYPGDQATDGGMEALLWALCTEDAASGGAAVLPPYRLTLRAGSDRGVASERTLHCVEVTGADVASTDSLLHSNRALFDLQKALWGCAALRGGGEAAALPSWLPVMLK